MQTTHTKLLAIRDKRKRWTTRLTRATNMLAKLARQEARLLKAEIRPLGKPFTEPFSEPAPLPEQPKPLVHFDDLAHLPSNQKPDGLDIPVVLKRKPQGTPEERTKMPLSDKEAMAYIKAQSAKVSAKRAKKDRPFMDRK